MYMKVTGVPTLEDLPAPDPRLAGKKLGVVNGAAWTNLWISYFGGLLLPGVKLIAVGSDAVQLNFMRAHRDGEACPPDVNRELFRDYAEQLVRLQGVDAVLLTCSTMNRAYKTVKEALAPHQVPVIQIDEPMMEEAVEHGGRILVVATHGPTVESTKALLGETAERLGRAVSFSGATVEEAFDKLGRGDVRGHNEIIARAIRESRDAEGIDIVVLAQLSMTVFKLSYPDCREEFGVPVLTSGETGLLRVKAVLSEQ
jgi:Asp/Glu/hydantoin racemase